MIGAPSFYDIWIYSFVRENQNITIEVIFVDRFEHFDILPFFILNYFRIKLGEKQYSDAFNEELDAFRARIQARAKARIEEAMKEYEEVNFFVFLK